MGGGTFLSYQSSSDDQDLSPRGRGNHVHGPRRKTHGGSIPAWAGEPRSSSGPSCPSKVYPRVGGGTIEESRLYSCCLGLSPRGRGNPGCGEQDILATRSIPAWAGEPQRINRYHYLQPVYPRVGGGTFRGAFTNARRVGLSPRGRGNQ